MLRFLLVFSALAFLTANLTAAEPSAITAALAKAGENRVQLQQALDQAPPEHCEALEFLVANMPIRDLQSLKADFLLEDARLSYQAWNESPWKDKLLKEVFFNNVLPYASINERRDAWRADFRQQFLPLVAEAKTPSAAAALLNQKIFQLLKVKYSTARPKADQSPHESIRAGLASCTGLSVLLIDACRSVGVPARFAGTPLWTNKSGNHSWVEVWDDGWHFTGAAEPNGSELDKAWFIERAATALREHPLHAIYAVSFQKTPLQFPLVWDRDIDYIHAVNVTDRYVARGTKLPEGQVRVMFRALDREGGRRVAAALSVTDSTGKVVFEGTTNDERFDANDDLKAVLTAGQEFQVELRLGERKRQAKLVADARDRPWTWALDGN